MPSRVTTPGGLFRFTEVPWSWAPQLVAGKLTDPIQGLSTHFKRAWLINKCSHVPCAPFTKGLPLFMPSMSSHKLVTPQATAAVHSAGVGRVLCGVIALSSHTESLPAMFLVSTSVRGFDISGQDDSLLRDHPVHCWCLVASLASVPEMPVTLSPTVTTRNVSDLAQCPRSPLWATEQVLWGLSLPCICR